MQIFQSKTAFYSCFYRKGNTIWLAGDGLHLDDLFPVSRVAVMHKGDAGHFIHGVI